jgi:hypothetical protein
VSGKLLAEERKKKKNNNNKKFVWGTKLPLVAIFVNGSEQNEQSL